MSTPIETAAEALLSTPGDQPGPDDVPTEAEWARYMVRAILGSLRAHRDDIARVIDPAAFTDWSGAHDPRAAVEQQQRQAVAYEHTDAVLAYLTGGAG